LGDTLLFLPAFDTTLDGFDGAINRADNEVRMQVIGFLAKIVIQRGLCFAFVSDTLGVVVLVPTVLASTVCTPEELISGFVECVALVIGNDQLDGCSTTHFHTSKLWRFDYLKSA
jgi:hypothetical protein